MEPTLDGPVGAAGAAPTRLAGGTVRAAAAATACGVTTKPPLAPARAMDAGTWQCVERKQRSGGPQEHTRALRRNSPPGAERRSKILEERERSHAGQRW